MHLIKYLLLIKITRLASSINAAILVFGACLSMLSACERDNLRVPIENDKTPPGPVYNVQVQNLNGAAKIDYSMPSDPDLLKVEANYEIRPGVKLQSVASSYGYSVILQGFQDTGAHKVEIYVVDKSNNKSKPVTVMVNPLISPVRLAYDSLSYIPYFGGLLLDFKNPSQSNISITIMTKDMVTGEWGIYDKYYTNTIGGPYIVSGLPDVPTTFGVFIQDRWDNRSDTMIQVLTPLLEQDLNATGKLSIYKLPGDNTSEPSSPGGSVWPIQDLLTGPHGTGHGYANYANQLLPQTVTIDLGKKAKLSRFRTWQISGTRVYQESNVKDFELWSSDNPNPNGDYDASWVLLGRYTVTKPSGLPYGKVNDLDIATAAAGDEFVLPGSPVVRYVRIKILSTFTAPEGSAGIVWLTGFNVWGQYQP